jgi:hypothetical protein
MVIDFTRLTVHILTADAYITGALVVPHRGNTPSGKPPRFLDVLNSPALFLKTPGEVSNDIAVILSDGMRHSFHGDPPRSFSSMHLRIDTVLLGSDEVPLGMSGTGFGSSASGIPERLELVLRGGLKVIGTVRGGSRAILFPRGSHGFVAATGVQYSTPLTPTELRDLAFAAINSRAVESVIPIDSPQPNF